MAKSKKRHSNSNAAVRQRAQENAIADKKDRDRKRMNPVTRNVLLGDAVFLVILEMLDRAGKLSALANAIGCFIGIILIGVALYFHFTGGSKTSSAPRLK